MNAIEDIETVWIPMPDGARLAARLWLPANAHEEPVPCILEYIPYRRRDHMRLRDEGMHPYFAQAGYAAIRGDMCSFAIPGDMPLDCRIDAAGALVFRGDALAEPVDILGQPDVSLTLSIDQLQGQIAVLLVDEHPDGAQTLITRGFCNLTHRNGDTDPQPVTPGEEMTMRVPLHGVGYRLLKGHRLMVQIATAYWPMLWPSPAPITATIAPGQSALHLPVRTATPDAPAPRRFADAPEPGPVNATFEGGALERTLTRDATTGVHTERVYIDGGVFGPIGTVTLETGTVLHETSERIYAIDPTDPLTAEARMDQTSSFRRGDWDALIKTWSKQVATEDAFHITARVECWEGQVLFFETDWEHIIPRNGM